MEIKMFIFHLLNSYNKPERLVFYYPHLIDEAFRSIGLRNGKKITKRYVHIWFRLIWLESWFNYGRFSRNLNRTIIWSNNSTPGYIFRKKPKILIRKDTHTSMFIAALTIAKTWKQRKCPSTDECQIFLTFSLFKNLKRLHFLAPLWCNRDQQLV